LQSADGVKSKIPPTVGSEHLAIGYWLAGSVVGVAILGMAYPIVSKMIARDSLTKEPFRVALVALLFLGSIAAMVFLYQATSKLWRGTFATLAGLGLVVIGAQPEVYRNDKEWFFSHYYYGIAASLLMIFSVAIVQDIYQDRQNRWRKVHIILNIFATLLFFGQGMTGSRDLFFWFKPS
jgi:peptidoglycan/LPS O-acetylase OafA/YrhL